MFNFKILIFIVILSLSLNVNGQSGRGRFSTRKQQKFARQELLTTTTVTPEEESTTLIDLPETTTTTVIVDEPTSSNGGPYSPSGWRPNGREFLLPTEIETNSNTPPTDSYGPPSNEYGPPVKNPNVNEIDIEDPDSIAIDAAELLNGPQQGSLYVRLPNGSLQKVSFSSIDNNTLGKIRVQPVQIQMKSEKLQQNPFNGFSFVRRNQRF